MSSTKKNVPAKKFEHYCATGKYPLGKRSCTRVVYNLDLKDVLKYSKRSRLFKGQHLIPISEGKTLVCK